jgi:hypothetical protein
LRTSSGITSNNSAFYKFGIRTLINNVVIDHSGEGNPQKMLAFATAQFVVGVLRVPKLMASARFSRITGFIVES